MYNVIAFIISLHSSFGVPVAVRAVLVCSMVGLADAPDEELAAVCDLDGDVGVHGVFAEEADSELFAGFLSCV